MGQCAASWFHAKTTLFPRRERWMNPGRRRSAKIWCSSGLDTPPMNKAKPFIPPVPMLFIGDRIPTVNDYAMSKVFTLSGGVELIF
ncbi:MAG: hypothetical protein ACFCU6_10415 [Balneolaceae bacterium]